MEDFDGYYDCICGTWISHMGVFGWFQTNTNLIASVFISIATFACLAVQDLHLFSECWCLVVEASYLICVFISFIFISCVFTLFFLFHEFGNNFLNNNLIATLSFSVATFMFLAVQNVHLFNEGFLLLFAGTNSALLY